MEGINRNNYESFFLDYLDGNLSAARRMDLMVFLRKNPDLKQELKDYKHIQLIQEQTEFPGKASLKKQLVVRDDPEYTLFDELCIDRLEGSLSPDQVKAFDQFLEEASPKKRKIYALYLETCLKPNPSIRFTSRDQLKKGSLFNLQGGYLYRALALAATLLLLAVVHFLVPDNAHIPYPDKLSDQLSIIEYQMDKLDDVFIDDWMDHKNMKDINYLPIDYQVVSNQINIEEKVTKQLQNKVIYRKSSFEKLQAIRGIQFSEEPLYADAVVTTFHPYHMNPEGGEISRQEMDIDPSDRIGRFVTHRIENPIKHTLSGQKFNLWEIAGLGVEGISKLTGKDIFLKRHYNQNGDLERLAFQTESFQIATRLNK